MNYYSGRVLNGPHKNEWLESYGPFVRAAIEKPLSPLKVQKEYIPVTEAVVVVEYQWNPYANGWTLYK